jgi:hypothetical protein
MSSPRPPWVVEAKHNQKEVDSIVKQLRIPSGWAPLRKPFKDLGFWKTAETVLFAGDVGAYYMRHIGIGDNIKSLFVEVFRLIHRYTRTLWHTIPHVGHHPTRRTPSHT